MTKQTPTYDALKLPEHIKTVLLTGAGGECTLTGAGERVKTKD